MMRRGLLLKALSHYLCKQIMNAHKKSQIFTCKPINPSTRVNENEGMTKGYKEYTVFGPNDGFTLGFW